MIPDEGMGYGLLMKNEPAMRKLNRPRIKLIYRGGAHAPTWCESCSTTGYSSCRMQNAQVDILAKFPDNRAISTAGVSPNGQLPWSTLEVNGGIHGKSP